MHGFKKSKGHQLNRVMILLRWTWQQLGLFSRLYIKRVCSFRMFPIREIKLFGWQVWQPAITPFLQLQIYWYISLNQWTRLINHFESYSILVIWGSFRMKAKSDIILYLKKMKGAFLLLMFGPSVCLIRCYQKWEVTLTALY
jgi:hypothetical protein